jgi:hypothetical protein
MEHEMNNVIADPDFLAAFRGRFVGILEWDQLDAFWQTLKDQADKGWYIYAIGEDVPTRVSTADEVRNFIREIDALLRKEHEEEYCGIVYADDKRNPGFIKIFDPNNLGVVCGYSDNPPLPGWILSTIAPVELNDSTILPGNRRRWWQRLWKKAS